MQSRAGTFETGAATHVGNVRSRNEDSFLVRPDAGLWAVSDGMGGHDDGDIASRTVIEALDGVAMPASAADLLADCEAKVAQANLRLKQLGREGGRTIGATVAVLLAFDGFYACVWSGDSRIYLVRERTIAQLSRDHTQVQELLSEGVLSVEEARTWPGRNVLTQAVGVFDTAELEVVSGPLHPGDSFVLCSDGLTNHVEDDEICDHVTTNKSQEACDDLVELALQRGGHDNVTVVVVRYHAGPAMRTVWPVAGPQGGQA